jgi:hypothetical protein
VGLLKIGFEKLVEASSPSRKIANTLDIFWYYYWLLQRDSDLVFPDLTDKPYILPWWNFLPTSSKRTLNPQTTFPLGPRGQTFSHLMNYSLREGLIHESLILFVMAAGPSIESGPMRG